MRKSFIVSGMILVALFAQSCQQEEPKKKRPTNQMGANNNKVNACTPEFMESLKKIDELSQKHRELVAQRKTEAETQKKLVVESCEKFKKQFDVNDKFVCLDSSSKQEIKEQEVDEICNVEANSAVACSPEVTQQIKEFKKISSDLASASASERQRFQTQLAQKCEKLLKEMPPICTLPGDDVQTRDEIRATCDTNKPVASTPAPAPAPAPSGEPDLDPPPPPSGETTGGTAVGTTAPSGGTAVGTTAPTGGTTVGTTTPPAGTTVGTTTPAAPVVAKEEPKQDDKKPETEAKPDVTAPTSQAAGSTRAKPAGSSTNTATTETETGKTEANELWRSLRPEDLSAKTVALRQTLKNFASSLKIIDAKTLMSTVENPLPQDQNQRKGFFEGKPAKFMDVRGQMSKSAFCQVNINGEGLKNGFAPLRPADQLDNVEIKRSGQYEAVMILFYQGKTGVSLTCSKDCPELNKCSFDLDDLHLSLGEVAQITLKNRAANVFQRDQGTGLTAPVCTGHLFSSLFGQHPVQQLQEIYALIGKIRSETGAAKLKSLEAADKKCEKLMKQLPEICRSGETLIRREQVRRDYCDYISAEIAQTKK